jgi:hypothetical protein
VPHDLGINRHFFLSRLCHRDAMEKPSLAMLAVFQAAAMEMTADQLLDLRIERILQGPRASPTIEAIDRELKRRNCPRHFQTASPHL